MPKTVKPSKGKAKRKTRKATPKKRVPKATRNLKRHSKRRSPTKSVRKRRSRNRSARLRVSKNVIYQQSEKIRKHSIVVSYGKGSKPVASKEAVSSTLSNLKASSFGKGKALKWQVMVDIKFKDENKKFVVRSVVGQGNTLDKAIENASEGSSLENKTWDSNGKTFNIKSTEKRIVGYKVSKFYSGPTPKVRKTKAKRKNKRSRRIRH